MENRKEYMSNYRKKYRKTRKGKEIRSAYNKRYYARTADAKNNYARWQQEEIDLIMEKNYSDMELSTILNRGIKAIQVKRAKVLGGY